MLTNGPGALPERTCRILNVRSADLTARARIRDAAITRFAEAGVAVTSVREIAADAGVSAGLVMHHFGSKEALREECDTWVVDRIIAGKRDQVEHGITVDPLATIRSFEDGPPVMRYLARTLVDGSPQVARLVDRLVADGEELSRQAVAMGAMHPTEDEHARAAVITLWSLGALVLHEQVRRLFGEDLLGDLTHATRYLSTTVELLGRPPLTDELYQQLREALITQKERTA